MRISVELASRKHLDEIAPLFDAYRQFFTGEPHLQTSRAFLEQRFEAGDAVIFAAAGEGRVVGFVQLYPLWSSWYCKRIWFLSDLYVAPEARKMGAGSLLIERVKTHARETGASSVMVELPQQEAALYAFYDRLGFHRDAVFDLARYHP